jgi:large conductance mechanosensitive channel
MIEEFKAFALKGNVVDLAVAVVIGAAFGRIVTSLVDNLITPLVGVFLGGVDVSDRTYTVGEAVFGYGAFVQAIIDFTIVALVIFFVIKLLNRAMRKEAKKPPAEKVVEPSEEVKLLREIRDGLRRS